ncbi:TIGR03086 family metal-binding protein [Embleya sp. NBC_00896]|uniref:TIGR03086 family metal-binding protein n=1 Tax=Embleya sp. NBC_00896 TaxID=2975961 RepID=UPI0038643C0B|nr:TIGR03086 family metal-binding protein [Embleya sp. NBC_00896]
MTDTANTTAAATAALPDPRPAFAGALALAGRTLAAVHPDRLDDPTPCADYTVRDLSDHLVAILRRVAAIGRGEDPLGLPDRATDIATGTWAAAWDEAVREVEGAWSDPAVLGRQYRLPFGTLPGALALVAYSTEFTLHTWDLATATGQDPAWDPHVLAPSLAAMHRALPAEPRGRPVPFAAVVDTAPDAPDIDRLVAWYGRRP